MSHASDVSPPRRLVFTILGPDQPGIVARVASVIAAHGGNWMESRMVRLGGQFAGLVQAEIPSLRFEDIRLAVEALSNAKLRVTMEETAEAPVAAATKTIRLELVAPDRPGILREVSKTLATHGANIEELETAFRAAPWTGELLFEAKITARASASTHLRELQIDLEEIAAGLMLDLKLLLDEG